MKPNEFKLSPVIQQLLCEKARSACNKGNTKAVEVYFHLAHLLLPTGGFGVGGFIDTEGNPSSCLNFFSCKGQQIVVDPSSVDICLAVVGNNSKMLSFKHTENKSYKEIAEAFYNFLIKDESIYVFF